MNQHLIVLISVTVLICGVTQASERPPPKMIDRFQSSYTPMSQAKGHVFYDRPNKRYFWLTTQPYPAAPWLPLNISRWADGSQGYNIVNQQCRDATSGFHDWFSWMRVSKWNQTHMVDGRMCDQFIYKTSTTKTTLIMEVVENKNIPVRYWGLTSKNEPFFAYEFGDDVNPDFDERALNEPITCKYRGQVYCKPGPVKRVTVMRIHDNGDYDITNHNTGDLKGDVAYICMSIYRKQNAQVSIFDVLMNTTWGQYGLCNAGECVGYSPNSVGRASMGNLHMFSGQCADNNDTGVWYSTDKRSRCGPDDPVGTNGCAWQVTRRIKTISTQCLDQLDLLQACMADQHIPFTKAEQIITQAFASNIPSNGGCPPIDPPTEHETRPHSTPTTTTTTMKIQPTNPAEEEIERLLAETSQLNSLSL